MTIKELIEKFKNYPNDTILERNLILVAKVNFVPEDPLTKYTLLEDETGTLDAVPDKRKIYEYLKSHIGNGEKLKLKGHLDRLH